MGFGGPSAAICGGCNAPFSYGCVVESLCPSCRFLNCVQCKDTGKGDGCPSKQCDGSWHSCHFCDTKPPGYKDSLASDAALREFLNLHPLNQAEALEVERSVERLRERLRRNRSS